MGTSPKVDGRAPIHVFASSRSWIEGNATQQLDHVAGLPGVRTVAAMPDLHPGKYGPVGCAILADRIHPQLVGSDIGCGMGLFELDIAARKLRLDQLAERLGALDLPWDGDLDGVRTDAGVTPPRSMPRSAASAAATISARSRPSRTSLRLRRPRRPGWNEVAPMSWSTPGLAASASRSWSGSCWPDRPRLIP